MEAISNIEMHMEVTDENDYLKDAYLDETYVITIESDSTLGGNTTVADEDMILCQGTGYTMLVPYCILSLSTASLLSLVHT